MAAELTTARLGRRERNKEDKVRRIREAARAQFVANGFDEASTRQIAVHAGVALDPCFSMEPTTRLVVLVVGDQSEAVASQAVAVVRPDASLMKKLAAVFRADPRILQSGTEAIVPTLCELMSSTQLVRQARCFVAIRDRLIALAREQIGAHGSGRGYRGRGSNIRPSGGLFPRSFRSR